MTAMPLDAQPHTRLDASQQDVGQLRSAPTPSGSRPGWAVIATRPKAESQVATGLAEQHFDAYLPMLLTRGKLHPLFPCYCFVWLDGHAWRDILFTRGVFDLLRDRDTGYPHIARAGVVEALQASEALRRVALPPQAMWQPGAAVRLATGSLSGHQGVVMEIGKHTAIVALLLFGHIREVNVPINALESQD